MDYTTVAKMKAAMDSKENVQDLMLADYVTRASRMVDKLCTSQPNVSDYFKLESISDEVLTNGAINYAGTLAVYPHKPFIASISAMAFRFSLRDTWQVVDLAYTNIESDTVYFEGCLPQVEKVYVKISYSGGLGATVDALPADLVDIATVMAVRIFKEERSGMSDVVGVVELGTLSYQKSWPARVIDLLNAGGYARIPAWT